MPNAVGYPWKKERDVFGEVAVAGVETYHEDGAENAEQP
jgi:hypothetical protein